jgi:hypothetical protein
MRREIGALTKKWEDPLGQVFLQDKIDKESGREGVVKARGGGGASRKTTLTKHGPLSFTHYVTF